MILEDRKGDQRSLPGWQALEAFFNRVWFERERGVDAKLLERLMHWKRTLCESCCCSVTVTYAIIVVNRIERVNFGEWPLTDSA